MPAADTDTQDSVRARRRRCAEPSRVSCRGRCRPRGFCHARLAFSTKRRHVFSFVVALSICPLFPPFSCSARIAVEPDFLVSAPAFRRVASRWCPVETYVTVLRLRTSCLSIARISPCMTSPWLNRAQIQLVAERLTHTSHPVLWLSFLLGACVNCHFLLK